MKKVVRYPIPPQQDLWWGISKRFVNLGRSPDEARKGDQRIVYDKMEVL